VKDKLKRIKGLNNKFTATIDGAPTNFTISGTNVLITTNIITTSVSLKEFYNILGEIPIYNINATPTQGPTQGGSKNRKSKRRSYKKNKRRNTKRRQYR